MVEHNGARTITIKPFDKYSPTYPICIHGETAQIMYSVSQDGKAENTDTCELGALESFVRIKFQNSQSIDKLEKYYKVMKELFSFLVGQNIIQLDVAIYKQDREGLLYKTAECDIKDAYLNHCKKSFHNVIPLNAFDAKIASALSLFEKKQKPFLVFLPSDNKDANLITYKNVEDLCTALEIEYGFKRFHSAKDDATSRLIAAINKAINDCQGAETNPSEELYNKAHSYMKYLSLSAADKVWT